MMSWFSALRDLVRLRRANGPAARHQYAAPTPGAVIDALLANIDPEAQGFGADVHLPEGSAHWPSAYALMASACLALHESRGCDDYLRRAVLSADWLVNNAGCASTSAPGWGVPYRRKIWEDKEPVAPRTAFAIPTSHTIQALDEAAVAADVEADALSFRRAAAGAAEYFAEHCCDVSNEEVVIWYSPLRQHSFHVSNAIAMMAGQFQRATRFSSRAELLADKADGAVRYLLTRRLADESGLGWNYFGDRMPSGKSNKKNDLLHDAFVCHGLTEYKTFGGRLASEIDYRDLQNTLWRFLRDGTFYEFPESESVKVRTVVPARAMGLGHALYAASRIEQATGQVSGLSKAMSDAICTQYVDQGDVYHRPGERKITSFVRDISHLLLGLTEYVRGSSIEAIEARPEARLEHRHEDVSGC